jgi:hypothetical protein
MRFDSEQLQVWKTANWDREAFPMLASPRPSSERPQRRKRLRSGEELFPDEVEGM